MILTIIIITNLDMTKGIKKMIIILTVIFIYSLLCFYLIVYKFAFWGLYGIPHDQDFGYLFVIFAWAVYIITFIPLILVKKSLTTKRKIPNFYLFIAFSPTILGFILLLVVSFPGRAFFKPIYNAKRDSIKQGLHFVPLTIENKGYSFDSKCNCSRLSVKGALNISNQVNFPLTLYLKPSFEQGFCTIASNSLYLYPIKQGKEVKEFECSFNEPINLKIGNLSDIKYSFVIEEKNNAGVQDERILSVSDFLNRINFP